MNMLTLKFCMMTLLLFNTVYSQTFESSLQKLRRKLKENGIFDADTQLSSKSLSDQYERFSDKVEFNMGIRARQPDSAQAAPKEIMTIAEKIFQDMISQKDLSDDFIELFKWQKL